jgi:hypothetical protein
VGVNYFLIGKECETCGHKQVELHIGKSSLGWCFALHQIPEDGLMSLDDWILKWSESDYSIINEYGEKISPTDMLRIITRRSGNNFNIPEDEYSEQGPNGLARHKLKRGWCSSHGVGTWDMMEGWFR